jgi:transcriptional regulator with XRE-family HTH domain
MKARFSTFLREERTRRGRGDARNFPQSEMARLLDVGLRQYQRWENPDDRSMPRWQGIEQIAEKLGVSVDEILGVIDEPERPPGHSGTEVDALLDIVQRLERLESKIDHLQGELSRLSGAPQSS